MRVAGLISGTSVDGIDVAVVDIGEAIQVVASKTVPYEPGVRNAIRGNTIHHNAGLGIDLGGDGVTANDAGDGDSGPNDLMNFPEGVTATYDKIQNTTVVRGHIDTPNPASIQVDIFANSKKDYPAAATILKKAMAEKGIVENSGR